jgi:transcription elongation factor Elf1
MDGADWLRTQLTSFACERCGRAYVSSDIRVLAQRDDLFVVDFQCEHCGSRAVAFVTVEIETSEEGDEAEGAEVEIERVTGPPAVAADDVLDMHLFLRDFDGDFGRLFAGAEHAPDADGR